MHVVRGARIPRQARLDVLSAGLFAAAVVAGTIAVSSAQSTRSIPLDALGVTLLIAAAAVTMGLRRVAPLGALAGAVVLVNGYLLACYPYGPVLLCLVIAVFEVARQQTLVRSAAACGLAAALASGTVLVRVLGDQHEPGLLALVWSSWIVLPWSLGALVHVRDAARRRARDDLISRTALEERIRMAGEVHDIAGHGFALITMQAGVALLAFEEQPDQARRSLEAVRDTSASALADLRGMLEAFHPEKSGLTGLAELIDRVRTGGLPVDITVDGLIPEPLAATVYRVVQEGLTNVLVHAGPTIARVTIGRRDAGLFVEVTDRGRGTPATVAPPGRGLTGMRRRVEELHGHLEAGPRDGGGFRVAARVPLPEAES
ncbi:sensor histidine kinase [Solihabitans fulvus]|uniref:histidine kinase n=1 Tax=Solihabitans fulvus TaxID=1892852 RepID=A0A5B2WH35_9PSEU|nr:histidine kinase [Solihabitans fulvus]KAA2250715.1 sensor histidine kinase [Solihabitans fulvus]